VAIALIGGFALYQVPIALLHPLLADGHSMEWELIAQLFRKQAI